MEIDPICTSEFENSEQVLLFIKEHFYKKMKKKCKALDHESQLLMCIDNYLNDDVMTIKDCDGLLVDLLSHMQVIYLAAFQTKSDENNFKN